MIITGVKFIATEILIYNRQCDENWSHAPKSERQAVMRLLEKFSSLFRGAAQANRYHDIYVRCNRCGEKLRVRVDMHNELSPEYGSSDNPSGYTCRKVAVGENRCFQSIEIVLKFDAKRCLLEKEIVGGDFLTEEEYTAGNPS